MLTFFGFMHGEAVGLAVTPTVAIAYGSVAVVLFVLSRAPESVAMPAQDKLVATLTKTQKKRKQRGAKQQPMAYLHLGGHGAPYYPKNKPARKGKHVQDHLVLQPG